MPKVERFEEIADVFDERVRRIVWCTVTTSDRQGRLRSRILHPVWEGSTAWICTGRESHKAKHIEHSPWVSLSYWDPQHQQVYADCRAEWVDDPAEKQRVWELFKSEEQPYGYDPAMFWPGGAEDPTFGLLRCTPWRLELAGMKLDADPPFESRVWRP
ncbi:MAG: pyridoxamine 5'-phosphate oxidase family protein [Thermoanaerobaculia bacterium]|nr:pyridoxamine 5'-phosphate oxidase family protein [Thermoanaerobaculia bacterium]